MARRTPRQIPRVSYCEPVETNVDEYIFCDKCGDDVYEYCAIHGPLLAIPDHKIPAVSPYPPIVPRAALSVPTEFLHLNYSSIPGAGLGVFASTRLGVGARFGPYRGRRTRALASDYCWQIYDARGAPAHLVDAADGDCSNWMRFVNCSRHSHEQNLLAFQYRGELYYRTIKVVPQYTELLVFYGSESAKKMNIDLKNYNFATHFAQKSAPPRKKPKLAIEDSSEKKCSPAHIKQTNITSDYGLPTVLCDGPATDSINTRDDNPKKLNCEKTGARSKIVLNHEQGKEHKEITTTKMSQKALKGKENMQYNVENKENSHEAKNTTRNRRSDAEVVLLKSDFPKSTPARQTNKSEITNKNASFIHKSKLADVNEQR